MKVVFDPFDLGWFSDYRPWTGIPGPVVWALQAGAIVWGHVVAVMAAQRVDLGPVDGRRLALGSHLPIIVLMVAYTFGGLWVLGDALQP